MAAHVKQELGEDVELVVGGRGEFTVWVDGRKVAEKGWFTFPGDREVVAAVRQALGAEV